MEQKLLCKKDRDAAILKNHTQPVFRKIGIQWKISATRLQDTQKSNHHLDGSLHANANQHIGANTELA